MKCRYKNCKLDNEVSKEDAVKEGNYYYHKECLREKNIKKEIVDFWNSNMPQATTMALNTAIKQLIDNRRSAEYVLFVLQYIHKNKKPINSPYGVINYCNNTYLEKEYNDMVIKNRYKEMMLEDSEDYSTNENITIFTYKKQIRNIKNII